MGWSPGLDISALWESCPHLTMVISLLSTILPGPAAPPCLLTSFPHPTLTGSCEQWGEGGQGSAGTTAAMPAQFCLKVQFTFLALPQPRQSLEDCSKAASNVAAGDNHQPHGFGKGGSFQEPQSSTACGSRPRALRREALRLPQPPKTSVVMFESPDPSRDRRRGCSRGKHREKYCVLQGRGNGGHHPDTTTGIQPAVYLKVCAGQGGWI